MKSGLLPITTLVLRDLAIELRGFAQEDGDVVGESLLHAFAHVGAHEEGIVLENPLEFGIHDIKSAL